MRLVDADSLKKTLRDQISDNWTEAFTGNDAGSELADIIDHAETIEQSPIVRAHWIKRNCNNVSGLIYECSNCNTVMFNAWNYCPHCGAKMDEV